MHTMLSSLLLILLAQPALAYVTPEEIFDLPPEAQTPSADSTAETPEQKAEIRSRIFYREGETKAIPEHDPSSSGFAEPTPENPVEEPVTTVPTEKPPAEPEEPAPLPEEELFVRPEAMSTPEVPAKKFSASGLSISMIIYGALAGVIGLGAIAFGLMRFMRRFRPSVLKEAAPPPPLPLDKQDEQSLPHLAMAMKAMQQPDAKPEQK